MLQTSQVVVSSLLIISNLFCQFLPLQNFEEPAAIFTNELMALSLFLNGGLIAVFDAFLLTSGLKVHSSISFSFLITSAHWDISSRFRLYWVPQVRRRSWTVKLFLLIISERCLTAFTKHCGALGSKAPLSMIFSLSWALLKLQTSYKIFRPHRGDGRTCLDDDALFW